MPRVYSYQFLNTEENKSVISTPSVPADRVLEVSRNGIGMRSSSGSIGTVTAAITKFLRQSKGTSGGAVTNKYIIPIAVVTSFSYREYTYEFGSVVTPNDVYRFQFNSFLGASYTVQLGDGVEDVRDGMKAALESINFGVTIDYTSPLLYGNRLIVKIYDLFKSFQTSISYGELFLYQSGYYATLDSKKYLVYYDDDFLNYPTLPSVSGSYSFSSLVLMPAGVEAYVNNPLYSKVSYSEEPFGNTSVTEFQGQGTMEAGRYIYNQSTQTLTFAEPLQPGEYIKMLYK